MNKGTLYLIPSPLSAGTARSMLTPRNAEILAGVRHFLAENVRTARRFLGSLGIYESVEKLHFEPLDKNTAPADIVALLSPLEQGRSMGVLSEAGVPGVADPGSAAVRYAHEHQIKVVPLAGSSAIILALMASGLNGQSFAFNGYLPVEDAAARKTIRDFEKESQRHGRTMLFIETPYRNNLLLSRLLKILAPSTMLCVAVDLTGAHEWISTSEVAKWRERKTNLPKLPGMFLFQA